LSGDNGVVGLLFCLKGARRRPKCPKQAEAGLVILPKILGGIRCRLAEGSCSPDIANSTKVIAFVIQITIAAPELAQYPAVKSRKKAIDSIDEIINT
jgi:hypothetical protein